MKSIVIKGARQGNLQDIDLVIPREQLVVLSGLSGSGKTTLAMDLLFQECQRRYLEALGMQGIKRPEADSIENIAPAILVTQTSANRNPRSTVGTLTGIYTDLRLVFEKLHRRNCPECGQSILAAECKEEVEKADGQFIGYMICSSCGHRMLKLTSGWFSFNTREGACPTCQGLGQTLQVNPPAVIDESLSLEDGAIGLWEGAVNNSYQCQSYYSALKHYGLTQPLGAPISSFTPEQRAILLHGVSSEQVTGMFAGVQPPKRVVDGRFEGVLTALVRRMSESGGEAKHLQKYFTYSDCPDCQGERLAWLPRTVTVGGRRLPELSLFSLEQLDGWAAEMTAQIGELEQTLSLPYLGDLQTKLRRLTRVGLGYLSPDRQAVSLSGGEAQRVKLAAALDSELSGVIYILDEPTIGLHSKDTEAMIEVLHQLTAESNSVIVIEHDTDVMRAADQIIDIGPASGKDGGRIVGQGSLAELMDQTGSVTGGYLRRLKSALPHPKPSYRQASEHVSVHGASLNNLRDVSVDFPVGQLTVVTGVSGSGKSTLVFDVLGAGDGQVGDGGGAGSGGGAGDGQVGDGGGAGGGEPQGGGAGGLRGSGRRGGSSGAGSNSRPAGRTEGLQHFSQVVRIEQAALTRMRRSNIATYTDIWSEVRKVFANLPEAKELGLGAKHFSFNTSGGRCENCGGLGVVESHMLFFPNADITCPVCNGQRFNDEVLSVSYQGSSINGVLKLTVAELPGVFENPKIIRAAGLLSEVGLGYLELGQLLTTLSGGEGQRLKLVRELLDAKDKQTLYLMDEPTTGLHPLDVETFLALVDRLTEAGNTVIAVEHNLQLAIAADWLIDLGPEGGVHGGDVVFTGRPADMLISGQGHTAEALRRYAAGR